MWQTHSCHHTQKQKVSLSNQEQVRPLSLLLFNAVLEVLATAVRTKKSMMSNQKEVKLSPFADDMVLYVVNPNDSTRKL